MMNPHNIREHKYKNGWRIAILQQPRAIWGSNEELRRQHKDTWVDTHTQERRHSDGNLYNTYILAEVTRTRQQNSSKQKREEGELPVVLSWSCQERETGGDRLQQRVWAGSPARGLQWETFRFHGIEETINEFDGSDRRQIEVVAETHEFPLLHSPSSFGCGWLTIPEIPDYGKGYIKSWHLEIPLLLLSYWCQCMLHDGPCKSYPFHLPLRGKRSQGHGGSEHQDWHLETAINTYSDTYSDLALVVK